MPKVMTIGRIGTLGACDCKKGNSSTLGGTSRKPARRGKASKRRSAKLRRMNAANKYCVAGKKSGKVFSCYSSAAKARTVAKKLGKGFKVKR